ncbi:T9SS type A sorting domain-containing protein [Winogradskyella aurantia]|uniref:Secretion system C-terminal sorting domain-containing protein n=1 Tax=Winogradskyella aurantia TaxID=1915063 RepID=A0A265UTG0_9FLAO|nr:T9SS type A sorting domain-containing protein [Winogradskyella aurantia]OZV68594.1 hypothetical protein CA834_08980 [Winogradskyella aurantia]
MITYIFSFLKLKFNLIFKFTFILFTLMPISVKAQVAFTAKHYDSISERSSNTNLGFVKLKIDNTSSTFFTDIYFNSNASLGLDPGYDAALFGGTAPAYSIYSLLVEGNTGVPLGIQTLGSNDLSGVTVPIGIHTPQGNQITVSIEEITIPEDVNVYFEDMVENNITLLNISDYTFTANTLLNSPGRFFLRFEGPPLNMDNSNFNALKIYAIKKAESIVIDGLLDSETRFTLYDLQGRLIKIKDINDSLSTRIIGFSNLSLGVHIIKLENKQGQTKTQKIILL